MSIGDHSSYSHFSPTRFDSMLSPPLELLNRAEYSRTAPLNRHSHLSIELNRLLCRKPGKVVRNGVVQCTLLMPVFRQ
jgi:hypothetical protein